MSLAFYCVPSAESTLPLIQLSLRLDGSPPPASAQEQLAALLRSASLHDLLAHLGVLS